MNISHFCLLKNTESSPVRSNTQIHCHQNPNHIIKFSKYIHRSMKIYQAEHETNYDTINKSQMYKERIVSALRLNLRIR
ncbi:hypothetical protein LOK49_LG10G00256 [Camellia lanceoleosa]|uniref:Uncharacterized protein n=1 Tax=Camellia lanceoleosa TaxID=1840588 RepID=A0ACC0G672_9ERIC|nr:hypothetical protein LOK49_LG10G00256 [Camellia lanceoleosa]